MVVCGHSGGKWVGAYLLWGFKKGVKELVRKYGVFIVEVVFFYIFCIDMEAFIGVEVRPFVLVLQHLHLVLDGVESVILFNKMFGIFGRVAVVFEGSRNRIVKFLPVCPTYAFLQSGHVSLYMPDRVYLSVVWVLRVSALRMVFTV